MSALYEIAIYVAAIVGSSGAAWLGWQILRLMGRGIRWVYEVYVYGL